MYLIVGLGNPGQEYHHTRHNAGFDLVDLLSDTFNIPTTEQKFHGRYGTGRIADEKVALLKPQTYMNLSGKSVQSAISFLKIDIEQVIVLHDELDFPLGTIRLKKGGGHGGHNGLRDIIAATGSRDFLRIRLGVGRPEKGDPARYLLSRRRNDEEGFYQAMFDDGLRVVESLLQNGFEATMKEYHTKSA